MEDWEKELRRKKKLDSLIINRPEVLHNMRRRAEISVTTAGWVVWIFLCRPALLVILWLVGFRFFFRHMIDLSGLAGLRELKLFYISVFIFIVLLIRGWNMYNKARYGKKKRRASMKGVSGEKIEECFDLPANSVDALRNMDEIDVDFLEDHQIRIKDSKNTSRQLTGKFRPT
jgi:poly-beta-1,6-N-acetyl-D-glucosamine biosynthesis protein PgaD